MSGAVAGPNREHESSPASAVKSRPILHALLTLLAVVLVFSICFGFYMLSGLHIASWSHARHFMFLAQAFMEGKVDLGPETPSRCDMTQFNGLWYVAFPPFPAVIFMPLIAIFGMGLKEEIVARVIGALNCALTWLMLGRISESRKFWPRVVLTLFMGFGTVQWYIATTGAVWFFAHLTAVTFLLLYILEVTKRNRPLAAAWWLGIASLCRTSALLGFPLFLTFCHSQGKADHWPWQSRLRKLAPFSLLLAAFVALMGYYNYIRFGAWNDFGYLHMEIAGVLLDRLRAHGLFSLYFLPKNLYHLLIAPPLIVPGHKFPYLVGDYWGNGLIFVSPLILYALRGLKKTYLSVGAALSALLISIPNLTYYNTGWMQFGYRFVLDFMPFLMILTALGLRGRVTKWCILALATSIMANFYGIYWFFRILIFGVKLWVD